MKTIYNSAARSWRFLFLISALQFLVPSFATAQDAFYIYRNDGDFNGFFFDEVIRMGYSKIGPDSVEYDAYVVQEIETEDSLYRIPLAAIDSIGFQQPEIRFNPRVRIIDQCELKDYYTESSVWGQEVQVFFDNLPTNLKPKVGDVLIKTESCMDDFYFGKGFSCVVDRVDFYEPNTTMAVGHFVTDPGEVFEQFISVEDVTVDEQGNVKRRLAGWHPENLQRRDAKSNEVTPIDFDLTLVQEWNPTDNSKIALETKLGMKLKLRATYDIGWTKLFAKLERELTTTTQASASIGLKGEFSKELDEIIQLPELIFPAACPIFGVNPYPTLFFRAWGEISAKVDLSQVELTLGDEVIFNTDWLFPIDFSFYIDLPKKNGDGKIISFENTSVKFAGSMQAGLKAIIDVGTANWMQKFIKGNVGFYAYIGPQIDAQLEFKTDWLNNDEKNLYQILRQAEVDVSLLSVNIEAKATARALWGEEQEKSFLTKDWKFLCDTLLLVPRFREPDAVTATIGEDKSVNIALHTKPRKLFYLNYLSIGLFEKTTDDDVDFNPKDMFLLGRFGDWEYSSREWKKYEYKLTIDKIKEMKLKGGKDYFLAPLVTWLGNGPYPAWDHNRGFICPMWIELESNELHFDAKGNEAYVEFTTNCVKDKIQLDIGDKYGSTWVSEARLEVIDEEKGKYRAVFKAKPNKTLWDRKILRDYGNAPGITLYPAYEGIYWGESHYLDVYQEANDLSNLEFEAYGSAAGPGDSGREGDWNNWDLGVPRHKVTATREDDNLIRVKGEYTEHSTKYYLSFEIQKKIHKSGVAEYYTSEVTNGSIREVESGHSINSIFHINESGMGLDSSDLKLTTQHYHSNGGYFGILGWVDGEEIRWTPKSYGEDWIPLP